MPPLRQGRWSPLSGNEDIAGRVLARIDRHRLAELKRQHADHSFAKYFDADYWIRMNVARARLLGLHEGGPGRVLDLGCGFGYFLLVCRELGHDVLGVDLQDPLYAAVTELLGVPCVAHEIKPFEPLPDLGSFDVMTANMVTFNGHVSWTTKTYPIATSPNLWGPREWAWLLDDVNAPLTYLELNTEMDGTIYPPGLREFFESRGARIDGHRVLMTRA